MVKRWKRWWNGSCGGVAVVARGWSGGGMVLVMVDLWWRWWGDGRAMVETTETRRMEGRRTTRTHYLIPRSVTIIFSRFNSPYSL